MQALRGEAARPGQLRRRKESDRRQRAITLAAAGVAVVGLFAAAGYQVGNIASARSAVPAGFHAVPGPAPAILGKGSLLADSPVRDPAPALAEERAIPVSLASAKSDILIETVTTSRSDRLARLLTPSVAQIERAWRAGREQRRLIAERKAHAAEHLCLSRAIYFEARSESELGQLAVARVILNRVKSPLYPNTICKVVYQNAEQPNACQFSFACNGRSDRARPGQAWEQAKRMASRLMAGEPVAGESVAEADVQVISTATHFHADYVRPSWSGTMTRLIKIGRHIFYSGS